MAQDYIVSQEGGIVSRTNDRGFTLEGRDGWLNISKYASGVSVPETGQRISVGLDKAGFVREVTVLDQPEKAAESESAAPTTPVDRETRIGRLAVLNTATAILSSGGQVAGVDAVLELAARLEAWVSR